MTTRERNLEQITEALGEVNRYYFWIETGKNSEEASPNDLLMFYILHQGAKHYAENHKEEK
jgi:hypothetical protein